MNSEQIQDEYRKFFNLNRHNEPSEHFCKFAEHISRLTRIEVLNLESSYSEGLLCKMEQADFSNMTVRLKMEEDFKAFAGQYKLVMIK